MLLGRSAITEARVAIRTASDPQPAERTPSSHLPPLSARPKELYIAGVALAGILRYLLLHVVLKFSGFAADLPLYVVVIGGGAPLVFDLAVKASRKEFGSDLLAAISIVVSAVIGEYLAGALVVLMLSGGMAIEAYAFGRAASALRAFASRFPSIAHRRLNGALVDIAVGAVAVGGRPPARNLPGRRRRDARPWRHG